MSTREISKDNIDFVDNGESVILTDENKKSICGNIRNISQIEQDYIDFKNMNGNHIKKEFCI